MDRIKETFKIPGIDKFKSMIYNSAEIEKKIITLESEKKHLQNLVKLKQSRINVHYEEYDKLKLRESKK